MAKGYLPEMRVGGQRPHIRRRAMDDWFAVVYSAWEGRLMNESGVEKGT